MTIHTLARLNPAGWFLPYDYDNRIDYVRAQWTGVFVLFLLWGLLLLLRFISQIVEWRRGAPARPLAQEERGERQPLLGEDGDVMDGGHHTTSVANVQVVLAGIQSDRLGRAARAARSAFLMLLAATILSTLPVPYSCLESHPIPGPVPAPVPLPPPRCTTCFATGASQTTSILTWAFTTLAILWVALEMAAIEALAGHVSRLILALVSYPIILAIFILVLKEWARIRSAGEAQCRNARG
ncbi:hypothetical protein HK104_000902 [Borealophlyctis nickersoniae]|nr:hypothetical protein HK104_000902 [Borealophlyctis nickersoniae]